MTSLSRLFFVALLLTALSVCVLGQDLGSSNKLFGAGKKPAGTASKTTKKTPATRSAPSKTKKPVVAKTRTPAKKTTAAAKTPAKPVKDSRTRSGTSTAVSKQP